MLFPMRLIFRVVSLAVTAALTEPSFIAVAGRFRKQGRRLGDESCNDACRRWQVNRRLIWGHTYRAAHTSRTPSLPFQHREIAGGKENRIRGLDIVLHSLPLSIRRVSQLALFIAPASLPSRAFPAGVLFASVHALPRGLRTTLQSASASAAILDASESTHT